LAGQKNTSILFKKNARQQTNLTETDAGYVLDCYRCIVRMMPAQCLVALLKGIALALGDESW
jgi:hypothetical protein